MNIDTLQTDDMAAAADEIITLATAMNAKAGDTAFIKASVPTLISDAERIKAILADLEHSSDS